MGIPKCEHLSSLFNKTFVVKMFVFSLRILITAIRIPLFGLICNRSFFFCCFFFNLPLSQRQKKETEGTSQNISYPLPRCLKWLVMVSFKRATRTHPAPTCVARITPHLYGLGYPIQPSPELTFPCVVVKFKQPFIWMFPSCLGGNWGRGISAHLIVQ